MFAVLLSLGYARPETNESPPVVPGGWALTQYWDQAFLIASFSFFS